MPANNVISFKLDDGTAETLDQLSAKQHISRSALIRKLMEIGLEHELAKENVDFIRTQLHDEIKATCFPQFDRIAKLEAKSGYQSSSTFYLLAYIMSNILPTNKQKDFEDIMREAKVMAISYLKLSEKEFAEFAESETTAVEKSNLQ